MIKFDKEKFLEEINKKWINKNCPMCGENNWNIDKNIVTPLKVDKKAGVSIGKSIFPVVPVVCTNCGNVLFVNPLAVDSLEHDEERTDG